MLGIPRRYSHFVFGVIQSGLTSLIAAGIASFPASGATVFLARVVADRVGRDAADRAARGAYDPRLLAAADARGEGSVRRPASMKKTRLGRAKRVKGYWRLRCWAATP